jgi:hypothetical protein
LWRGVGRAGIGVVGEAWVGQGGMRQGR